jgi:PAS domain S-box-containing protein
MSLGITQETDHNIRILLLEDRDTDAELMEHTLTKSGINAEILRASNEEEYRRLLRESPDVILSEYSLPLFKAQEALRIAKECAPGVPFIIVTGAVTEETAAISVRDGAADYIMKDNLTRLPHAVTEALSKRQLTLEKADAETRYEWSETLYRTVFNTIQTGIVIIDPEDHRIVDINPSLAALIGLPRDRIVGQGCQTFICPSEVGKCPITDLQQPLDSSECYLLTSAGTRVPIHKIVAPLAYGGKKYLVESILDITEHVEARRRIGDLLESSNNAIFSLEKDIAGLMIEKDHIIQEKERYKALSAGLTGIVLTLSPSGTITCIRSLSGELFGYRENELLGTPFHHLIPPDDHEDISRFLNRAQAGDVKPHDIRIKGRDGAVRPGRIAVRPVYENGDLRALSVILADLAEWIQATESLQQHQKTLAALFESIPVPLMEIGQVRLESQKAGVMAEGTDAGGNNRFHPLWGNIRVNPPMEEFISMTSLGQPARLLDDPDMNELVQAVTLTMRDGATRTGTLSIPSTNNEVVSAGYTVIRGVYAVYVSILPKSPDKGRGSEREHALLEIVLGLLPVASVICAQSGIITVASTSASNMLGYPGPGDLVGIPLVNAVGAFDRQRLAEQVRESFGGLGRIGEYLCLRRDGSQFPASLEILPVNRDGQVSSCIVHIHPITV